MKIKALLPLFALLFLTLPAAAQDVDLDVFDEAHQLVKKRFYDKNYHGVDWNAMKEKYRPEAEKCATQRELHGVINKMIGELKASHCVLVEGDVYTDHFAPEFRGKKTLRNGFEIGQMEGKLFVSRMYEGGAADKSDLRVGDEIVRINGVKAKKNKDLVDAGSDQGFGHEPHYFIRVREGEKLSLVVRRKKGGKTRKITFTPDKISLIHATRNSIRVIEYKGRKFAYIHLWHYLSGSIARALRDAIDEEFADCDGMILDIRGRGGSPMVMNTVYRYFKGRRARWKKPVVCLVDEGSRSAKDVFAYNWKKDKVGPLVGTETAGAVLGSTFFPLSDGSYMLLAITDVAMLTGGVKLEGNPVQPTVRVRRDLRYCEGKDAILEKGISTLHKLLTWY